MTQNPHTTSFPLTREDLPPSHILQQSESAFEPLGTPQQLTYFIGSSETFVDVEDIGADVMHEEFRLQALRYVDECSKYHKERNDLLRRVQELTLALDKIENEGRPEGEVSALRLNQNTLQETPIQRNQVQDTLIQPGAKDLQDATQQQDDAVQKLKQGENQMNDAEDYALELDPSPEELAEQRWKDALAYSERRLLRMTEEYKRTEGKLDKLYQDLHRTEELKRRAFAHTLELESDLRNMARKQDQSDLIQRDLERRMIDENRNATLYHRHVENDLRDMTGKHRQAEHTIDKLTCELQATARAKNAAEAKVKHYETELQETIKQRNEALNEKVMEIEKYAKMLENIFSINAEWLESFARIQKRDHELLFPETEEEE